MSNCSALGSARSATFAEKTIRKYTDGVTPTTCPARLVPSATPLGGVPAPNGAAPVLHDASSKAGLPQSTCWIPEESSAGSATLPEGSATPGKYFQVEFAVTSDTGVV